MKRRILLTIRTRTMVPVIATTEAIVEIDSDALPETITRVAKGIIEGQVPNTVSVEDSTTDTVSIEGTEDWQELDQQVVDHLQKAGVKSEMLDFDVSDAKPKPGTVVISEGE